MTQKQLRSISENPAEYLSQTFDIEKQINIKAARIGRLREIAESTTAKLSKTSGGGKAQVSDKIASGVAAIIEVENEIGDQLKELAQIQRDIQYALQELVLTEKYRTVLETRYLACLPWDVVAEKLGQTRRWVMTLHGRALKEMTANCMLKIFESA